MADGSKQVLAIDLESRVIDVIAQITSTADARLDEIAGAIVSRLISEIDYFAADQPILDQLSAGAIHNFAITMKILRHDVDIEQVGPSAPAIEIAKLLAQRDIPITALEHAYRLYQESVVRWCLEELSERSNSAAVTARAALEISTLVSAHVNLIAQQLLSTYESERDAWRLRRTASRSARIHDVLAGRTVDVPPTENILGYRFGQYHLGVIIWTDNSHSTEGEVANLEAAATTMAEVLSACAQPLFETRNGHMARAWIPLGRTGSVTPECLETLTDGRLGAVAVSMGNPRYGLEGFIRTHDEANATRRVMQASRMAGLKFVQTGELGAVALMCSDLTATSAWVSDLLGPLAVDDAATEQSRATLREFFRAGGSYTATAEALHMHKNSVLYRIRKIEDELGRSVRDHCLDLENALELSFWLGAAVLNKPETP
ncbi:PucR family transcriptional regulator [Rhodococcus sp. NPDC127530]|uniref:PucR family transcriptional regulator n=1 Tax=unclassified Rhodococcus (in: high G+C Gram-positive bacteria) TaxID=192944 RepID=UPI003636AB97